MSSALVALAWNYRVDFVHFGSLSGLLFLFIRWYFYHVFYNFQRWMSRFEQRWRAQRSAISIVNCRIPWTDRNLNAYCAFGISLKACLLQCLCFVVPVVLPCLAYYCECSCFKMCVSPFGCWLALLKHLIDRVLLWPPVFWASRCAANWVVLHLCSCSCTA